MLLADVQMNVPMPIRILLLIAASAFGVWMCYGMIKDTILEWGSTRHGKPAIGWIVQANDKLYEEGRGNAAGLVLVSPDEKTEQDEAYMTELVERMISLRSSRRRTKDEKYVWSLMEDGTYLSGQRDELPQSFTGGPEVYAAHVIVQRFFLPKKRITKPYVHCLIPWASPGSPAWTISPKEFKERKQKERAAEGDDEGDE